MRGEACKAVTDAGADVTRDVMTRHVSCTFPGARRMEAEPSACKLRVLLMFEVVAQPAMHTMHPMAALWVPDGFRASWDCMHAA
jgi:hypothetical protein